MLSDGDRALLNSLPPYVLQFIANTPPDQWQVTPKQVQGTDGYQVALAIQTYPYPVWAWNTWTTDGTLPAELSAAAAEILSPSGEEQMERLDTNQLKLIATAPAAQWYIRPANPGGGVTIYEVNLNVPGGKNPDGSTWNDVVWSGWRPTQAEAEALPAHLAAVASQILATRAAEPPAQPSGGTAPAGPVKSATP